MTISDEDLARLQREASERAARNWDPSEAQLFNGSPRPTVRRETETEDQMLARMQQEATRRAQSNWDPTEAQDFNGHFRAIVHSTVDAFQAIADDLADRRVSAYWPGSYPEYLRTAHWRQTRQRALQRAGFRCQRCDDLAPPLEVHHRDYRHLGAERERDLIVLCRVCHFHAHGDDDGG